MNQPEQAPTAAQIHDLGYKRYVGSRRPQRSRYRVIVRNMLRMSWRGWWRAKAWIIGSAMVVFGLGTAMMVYREKLADKAERMGGFALAIPDTLLAQSFQWLAWMAFLLTMTVIAGTVARDLRAGAFEFYFSRPVRSLDYVLGKLGGACLLVGGPLLVGPTLLSLFRVGLETDKLGSVWKVVPETILIGVISTVVYAAIPLAFSALARRVRDAMILWAAFYLVIGGLARAAAIVSGAKILYAFDVYGALLGVTYGFYGWSFGAGRIIPPLGLSLAVLSAYAVGAVALLFWRVRAIERAGIGGGK